MKLFKRLFCKHENLICITNFYGDYINYYNCRALYECINCGKLIKSDKLNKDCRIINFRNQDRNLENIEKLWENEN